MQWETPSYVDLNMNAEIGAYQDDFGGADRRRADDPSALHSGPAQGQLGRVDINVGSV
jgi:hypothetical protein